MNTLTDFADEHGTTNDINRSTVTNTLQTDDITAHTITNTTPNTNPTDNITTITGIGDTTAEETFANTTTELRKSGFTTNINTRHLSPAITELYALRARNTATTGADEDVHDAARVMLGLLGGVGYTNTGERVTAADLLTGRDADDIIFAGIRKYTDRLDEDEYVTNLITDMRESKKRAACIGEFTVEDVAEITYGDADVRDVTRVSNEHDADTIPNTDRVTLESGAEHRARVHGRLLEVIATTVNVDISMLQTSEMRVSIVESDSRGWCVVLENTTSPVAGMIRVDSRTPELNDLRARITE